MTNIELSEELWKEYSNQRIDRVKETDKDKLPTGVEEVSERVQRKVAFFPGGNGYFCGCSTADILVLGQDFGTVKCHSSMLDIEGEQDTASPTWVNMSRLFNEAEIDLDGCFFSNVFMGLRTGDNKTGRFPGYKDKNFVMKNVELLKKQIALIKPKLIITLGNYSADMLLRAAGVRAHSRRSRVSGITDISSVSLDSGDYIWVALVHPSMRNSNVGRRSYKGRTGYEAEVAMLTDALKML